MNKKWNLQKNTLFPTVNYYELTMNSDCYKLFVDYLKVSYNDKSIILDHYKNLLVSENSDNSLLELNWIVISVNSFYWKFGFGLRFTVSYNSIPVELCTVQFMEKWFNDKVLYTIEFKWQYFRLEDIWYFEKWFFKKVCKYFFGSSVWNITRIDRTIDFIQKKDSSSKNLYIVSPIQFLGRSWIRDNWNCNLIQKWKAVKAYSKQGREKLEKIDFWNWYYGSRKWKRVYFRMYDKKKDLSQSTWKWKELLYLDYMWYKKVVRCEFECLYRFCFGYTLDTLDKLIEKCDSVFHLSDNEWKGATCYEYKHSENVIDLNRKSEYFKLRYFDNFWQHWFTIFENDINPYLILNEQIKNRTESQFLPYTKIKIKDFLREASDSIDI